jgi:energy-coupling factor transport system substrate-specific component
VTGVKFSKRQQFFIVLAAFLVMGIPFKVMVLVEGFTELRPVNAIPPLAGLICGPVGALACGIGNLIDDLFGTFNSTSILGFFGNFIAAYMPYRIWHIYSDEQPNLHKNSNILKYIFNCFTTALTVSWILGFGLNYFFGTWIEQIYTYVFFNNFGFSVGLGMPVFIMLSSEDVQIECVPKPKQYRLLKNERMRKIIPVLYTVVMTVLLVWILAFHVSPAGNIPMAVLSAIGLCGLLVMLF